VNHVKSIAILELKRMRRNYMTWFLCLCAIFLLFLMDLFNYFTIEEQVKMIKDFSLGLMNMTALVLVVFYPVILLKEEIDGRFVYNLLSKPVSRTQVLLGKMGAVVGLVMMALLLNSISLYIMLLGKGVPWDLDLTMAVTLIFLKNTLLIGFAAIFALLPINAILGAILTLGVYCLGSTKSFFLDMASHGHDVHESAREAAAPVAQLVMSIIPNLRIYDLVEKITLGMDVPPMHLFNCILHFTGVSILTYGAAIVIFNKREV